MSFEDSLYEVVRRAVSNELQKQIFEVRKTLIPIAPQPPTGKYLNAAEAAAFLGIKIQTLYQNIDKVPHVKRFGKLAFLEVDLVDYMEGGRQ